MFDCFVGPSSPKEPVPNIRVGKKGKLEGTDGGGLSSLRLSKDYRSPFRSLHSLVARKTGDVFELDRQRQSGAAVVAGGGPPVPEQKRSVLKRLFKPASARVVPFQDVPGRRSAAIAAITGTLDLGPAGGTWRLLGDGTGGRSSAGPLYRWVPIGTVSEGGTYVDVEGGLFKRLLRQPDGTACVIDDQGCAGPLPGAVGADPALPRGIERLQLLGAAKDGQGTWHLLDSKGQVARVPAGHAVQDAQFLPVAFDESPGVRLASVSTCGTLNPIASARGGQVFAMGIDERRHLAAYRLEAHRDERGHSFLWSAVPADPGAVGSLMGFHTGADGLGEPVLHAVYEDRERLPTREYRDGAWRDGPDLDTALIVEREAGLASPRIHPDAVVAVDPDRRLLLGVDNGIVHASLDGGRWRRLAGAPEGVRCVKTDPMGQAQDPAGLGQVYVQLADGRIARMALQNINLSVRLDDRPRAGFVKEQVSAGHLTVMGHSAGDFAVAPDGGLCVQQADGRLQLMRANREMVAEVQPPSLGRLAWVGVRNDNQMVALTEGADGRLRLSRLVENRFSPAGWQWQEMKLPVVESGTARLAAAKINREGALHVRLVQPEGGQDAISFLRLSGWTAEHPLWEPAADLQGPRWMDRLMERSDHRKSVPGGRTLRPEIQVAGLSTSRLPEVKRTLRNALHHARQILKAPVHAGKYVQHAAHGRQGLRSAYTGAEDISREFFDTARWPQEGMTRYAQRPQDEALAEDIEKLRDDIVLDAQTALTNIGLCTRFLNGSCEPDPRRPQGRRHGKDLVDALAWKWNLFAHAEALREPGEGRDGQPRDDVTRIVKLLRDMGDEQRGLRLVPPKTGGSAQRDPNDDVAALKLRLMHATNAMAGLMSCADRKGLEELRRHYLGNECWQYANLGFPDFARMESTYNVMRRLAQSLGKTTGGLHRMVGDLLDVRSTEAMADRIAELFLGQKHRETIIWRHGISAGAMGSLIVPFIPALNIGSLGGRNYRIEAEILDNNAVAFFVLSGRHASSGVGLGYGADVGALKGHVGAQGRHWMDKSDGMGFVVPRENLPKFFKKLLSDDRDMLGLFQLCASPGAVSFGEHQIDINATGTLSTRKLLAVGPRIGAGGAANILHWRKNRYDNRGQTPDGRSRVGWKDRDYWWQILANLSGNVGIFTQQLWSLGDKPVSGTVGTADVPLLGGSFNLPAHNGFRCEGQYGVPARPPRAEWEAMRQEALRLFPAHGARVRTALAQLPLDRPERWGADHDVALTRLREEANGWEAVDAAAKQVFVQKLDTLHMLDRLARANKPSVRNFWLEGEHSVKDIFTRKRGLKQWLEERLNRRPVHGPDDDTRERVNQSPTLEMILRMAADGRYTNIKNREQLSHAGWMALHEAILQGRVIPADGGTNAEGLQRFVLGRHAEYLQGHSIVLADIGLHTGSLNTGFVRNEVSSLGIGTPGWVRYDMAPAPAPATATATATATLMDLNRPLPNVFERPVVEHEPLVTAQPPQANERHRTSTELPRQTWAEWVQNHLHRADGYLRGLWR